MPPRVPLSDAEAARLPGLLASPAAVDRPFPRAADNPQRVLWVVAAYDDGAPLSPALITWLVFDHGPNLALASVEAALAQARARGWLTPDQAAPQLTAAGRNRLDRA